jgi:K+-sensing histidine kinase KdpD
MSSSRRYGVAILAVAVAFVLRLALQDWLGREVPFLQFFPAIVLAAWFGGFGPGCVATLTSAGLAVVFVLTPADRVVTTDPADLGALLLFVTIGLAISWVFDRLRETEAALRASVAGERA